MLFFTERWCLPIVAGFYKLISSSRCHLSHLVSAPQAHLVDFCCHVDSEHTPGDQIWPRWARSPDFCVSSLLSPSHSVSWSLVLGHWTQWSQAMPLRVPKPHRQATRNQLADHFLHSKTQESEGFCVEWWECQCEYPHTWRLLEWTGSLSATKDGGDFFLLNLPFPEKTRKTCRLL